MSLDEGFAYDDPHAYQPDDAAYLAALDAEFGHHIAPTNEDRFINWAEFWKRDRTQADWLFENVLARGRGHAIYAMHKKGKSLFMLWVAAFLAVFSDVVVIYGDYEMTEDDVQERLEDMGYGPDTDLSRLRYWLLPNLPPLDTPHGGLELLAIVDEVADEFPDKHIVVVLDTMGRAVMGAENESDTYQNFYTYSGIGLKRRGCTWARLDHAGKDPTKAQRGSSAKGDDVDIVWKLDRNDDGISIRHGGVTRIRWAPEKVVFKQLQNPLRYEQIPAAWPAGTAGTAQLLDDLGVPDDVSGNKAQEALRDAGEGRTREVVLAAVRYRKARTTQRTTPTPAAGTTPRTTPQEARNDGSEPPTEPPRTTTATQREPVSPPRGEPVPGPDDEDLAGGDCGCQTLHGCEHDQPALRVVR